LSYIDRLRKAKTLDDIAPLLGFTPRGLSYILYKIPNSVKYTTFEIPKSSGEKRRNRSWRCYNAV